MIGELIKQGTLIKQLEINLSEETKEFLLEALKGEPVTAYVISDEDGNIKCSNCGSSECWGNYCMNCGAKMGKE